VEIVINITVLVCLAQYTLGLMFYFCYLLLYFLLYYPLDLRTSEWTARKYFMNSWGYGVILISHDWIRHLVPSGVLLKMEVGIRKGEWRRS